MTRKKDDLLDSQEVTITKDKGFRKILNSLNNLTGQANLNLYGTDRNSDVDSLNKKFNSILQNQITDLKTTNEEDVTSFLNQIISSNNKNKAASDLLSNQFLALSGDDYSSMQSFIYDSYRNKLLEQSDLHEISSQLIELSEAILITRDAIISADVIEGRMNRSLHFDNTDEDEEANNISIVEKMEKQNKLLEKIKNFIIPKTLEYGSYYAYTIPYSKLFNNFMDMKRLDKIGGSSQYTESVDLTVTMSGNEFTVLERVENTGTNSKSKGTTSQTDFNKFITEAYEDYTVQYRTMYVQEGQTVPEKVSKDEFKKDMKNILGNISICNDPIPIPVLEEGVESLRFMKESFYDSTVTEKDDSKNIFNQINKSSIDPEKGITFENEKKNKGSNEFDGIKDCYIKMIEPTRIIPLKIMNTTIGYYYIQDEDITPLSGVVSGTLYYSRFDEHKKEKTIIDSIAKQIVKSFDKPFLEKNIKFKEMITDAIQYYNLNEKRVKFQFIPVEYMQEFKIDEDVDGNGTSMIKKSLFYAKLYLMLLLFKIMSIIVNGNDTKVNYIRQSGIDKNLANKVQEIARLKQSRQINITDLFSYTNLINKVGAGQEMYIPTGRSGERPIETEILSGQDIPLNSDLLEMLKNAYILGTGVPAAIVNYLNEADFAKVIEQNNTKFNGRVINYQLDFNTYITEWYKKIMKWSTNISESAISNFKFILQPPKTVSINTKSELIGQFNSIIDFLITILYDDPQQNMEDVDLINEIKEFKKLMAEDQLSMINFDDVRQMMEKAKLIVKEKKLKPNPANGDTGDDLGLDMSDEELGM